MTRGEVWVLVRNDTGEELGVYTPCSLSRENGNVTRGEAWALGRDDTGEEMGVHTPCAGSMLC